MDSRALNRRVTIKRFVPGQDSIGQPTTVLEDVATVWANILHKSGSETIRADKETSIVQSSIRIRRRTDLNAGMQVHHGSVVYEIKAILPDEVDRERVDLVCEIVQP
jgi:SPP1 family predicted phage head-tail adaptor